MTRLTRSEDIEAERRDEVRDIHREQLAAKDAEIASLQSQLTAERERAEKAERHLELSRQNIVGIERDRDEFWNKFQAEVTRGKTAREERDAALAKARELRELLSVAKDAVSDARDFTATTLAKIGDGHRIAEIVQDFDYAFARIDAKLTEGA
jgi:chromosome segregation ATPase